MHQQIRTHYPIAIVGGGIVGKTLALILKGSGMFKSGDICLIDSGPALYKSNIKKHDRKFMISKSGLKSFQHANVWEDINRLDAFPVYKISIFDSDISSCYTFDDFLGHTYRAWMHCGSKSVANLHGHIVSSNIIEQTLNKGLEDNDNIVDWIRGSEMRDMVQTAKNTLRTVTIRNKGDQNVNQITANLVIGADGIASKTRTLSKIKCFEYDHQQHGLVATLKLSDKLIHNSAYQRFLSTGPIGLLPLSQTHVSMVWTIPSSWKDRVLCLDKDRLIKVINIAIDGCLSDLIYNLEFDGHNSISAKNNHICDIDMDTLNSFPLKSRITPRSTANRLVLVGDSAHSIHPYLGQGLNMGLLDVFTLSQILIESKTCGLDVGDPFRLAVYSRLRDPRNLAFQQFINGVLSLMTKLSSTHYPSDLLTPDKLYRDFSQSKLFQPNIVDRLRRLGIHLFDKSTTLKSLLTEVLIH